MTTTTLNQKAFDGFMAVRDSGATNMFDVPKVIEIADMMGHSETVAWLTSTDNGYMDMMLTGQYTIKDDA